MKKLKHLIQLIFIVVITLLIGCDTPEYLLKEGKYDTSVEKSIQRLQRKKKIKQEDVAVFEEAFQKVTSIDLTKIASLKSEGRVSNWVAINKIHNKIKNRQEKIAPLLPLRDKDGYKATIIFVDINPMEKESRENAAEYYYTTGKSLLEKAEQGDKNAARRSHANLGKIKQYFDRYKNTGILQNKAVLLGTSHVLVKITNESEALVSKQFKDEMASINIKDFSSNWIKYYNNPDKKKDFDYEFNLKLQSIKVSPELVQESQHVDKKEIQEGFNYVLDDNGNVLKDTLGNDVKTPIHITIEAVVVGLHQKKSTDITTRLVLKDLSNGEIIRYKNIQESTAFEHYTATFKGDERALTDESKKTLEKKSIAFPSDEKLLLDTFKKLKPTLYEYIKNWTIP